MIHDTVQVERSARVALSVSCMLAPALTCVNFKCATSPQRIDYSLHGFQGCDHPTGILVGCSWGPIVVLGEQYDLGAAGLVTTGLWPLVAADHDER